MGILRFYLLGVIIYIQVSFSVCHSSPTAHTHQASKPASSSSAPPISDHRFFLHEIFTKYGHDGQMTFEGFEHLLESLGLGNIIITDHKVDAHKQDEFKSIHGSHDHSKKVDVTPTTSKGIVHTNRGPHTHSNNHPTEETMTSPGSPSSLIRQPHRSHNSLPTSHPKKDSSTDHDHSHKGNSTDDPRSNKTSAESIYHYHLSEVKIPELLVNISILVDQHQELQQRSPGVVIEQCLSPREILEAFGINQTTSLNPVSFLHLCPAIIYELDQGHCLFRDRDHEKEKSIASFDQWIFSTIAVVIISLCGLLSVAVIPIMQKWFYHTLLQFLIGLAIGSLTGDGLLHLMPHAMLGGEGDHDHNGPVSAVAAEKIAIWRGLAALGGIFFFFVAERLLGNYAKYRKRRKDLKASKSKVLDEKLENEELPNVKNVGEKLSQYKKSSYDFDISEKEMIQMLNADSFSSRKNSLENLPALEASFQKKPDFSVRSGAPSPGGDCSIVVPDHRSHAHGHGHGHSHEVPDSVTAVAWMVIMGDGLHNFCDGLAIGAAFAAGIEGGISTAVAVFCHELPHELGDFAMLLKTGMKVKQALMYNGLSSILCFIGMLIGVSLGNVHSATSWVFAATAGMFLYIALVDMLPELTAADDSETASNYHLAVQVLGISCGVSIMLLIANYEQELQTFMNAS
ncbi:zinc transporter ZIP10-like [Argiope bruennichi]|uniref:zinc transporter ZIP10-like n=1 Tax=Argiope bruennichi TaxID=94029 RepID=UPI002495A2A8|nr:zinc transporter ZIP10-like [Argiope bruennichi]XP_055942737.1 zinc transporter ZIP10-like [Argiope bruennichi]XP_055942738.1 zinc transporter ZIP10-like [Argiope bruennichi]XP_055942739.1 zinc transporter ZIP10-like [Argiope bruennichi]XP_055942740.1 zinc transporter ZIP10-like [Argiope bruennichi]